MSDAFNPEGLLDAPLNTPGNFTEAKPPPTDRPPNPFGGERAPNPFDDIKTNPADILRPGPKPGLGERFRLNAESAEDHSTTGMLGALVNRQIADGRAISPGGGASGPAEWTPGVEQPKPQERLPTDRERFEAIEKLNRIRTEMMLYEKMPWSSSTIEFTTAFAGQLWGGKFAPETYLMPGVGKIAAFAAAKGAGPALSRAMALGISAGGTQAAVDPLIQHMGIKAQLSNEYNYWQTAIAAGSGVGFGFLFAAPAGARALIHGWRTEAPPPPRNAPQTAAETPQQAFARQADAAKAPVLEPTKPDAGRQMFDAAAGREAPPEPNTVPVEGRAPADTPLALSVVKGDKPDAPAAAAPTRNQLLERIDEIDIALNTERDKATRTKLQTELADLEKRLKETPRSETTITINGETTTLRDGQQVAAFRDVPPERMAYGERAAADLGERNGVDIRGQYPNNGREPTAPDVAPFTVQVREGSRPPAVLGTTTDVKVNLRDMWRGFADDLGLLVRQGRMRLRGAAGEYDFGKSIARMKQADDPTVLAHEAGHFIEHQYPTEIQSMVAANSGELSNITAYAKGQATPEQRVSEGFAEYFRLLNENPPEAQKRAPGFDATFQNFLINNPDVGMAVSKFQAGLEAYAGASPEAKTLSQQATMQDTKGFWGKFAEGRKHDGLANTIMARFDRFHNAIFDQDHMLYRVVRNVAKLVSEREGKLIELNVADDPHKLAYLAQRSYETTLSHFQHGVTMGPGQKPVVPGIADVLVDVMGKANSFSNWSDGPIAEFGNYLMNRWAVHLWRRWQAGAQTDPHPTGFKPWEHAAAVAEYEKRNGKAQTWAERIYDWQQARLDYYFQNHALTREAYEKYRADREYVPMNRDMSDRRGDKPPSNTGAGVDLRQPIMKKFKGSARPIINPVESIINNALMRDSVIAANRLPEALARLAQRAETTRTGAPTDVARWVERVPAHEVRAMATDAVEAMKKLVERELNMAPQDADAFVVNALNQMQINGVGVGPVNLFRATPAAKRGENIVFYLARGELQALRLPEGQFGQSVAESLTLGHGPPMQDFLVNKLSMASNWLRLGVVTNPSYFLANFTRDQYAAFTLTRGYIPMVDGVRGIASAIANDEFAQMYARAGGTSGGFALAALDKVVEHDLTAFTRRTGLSVKRITPEEIFRFGFKIAEASETGTRLGIFKAQYARNIKAGLSPDNAALNAAYEASDFLPFGRGGSQTQVMQRLVPFMAGNMQGMNKTWRTMITPAARRIAGQEVTTQDAAAFNNMVMAWSKLAAQSAFHAAYRAAYIGDPEFEEFSDIVRNRYTLFKINGQWMAMPKPFELAIPLNLAERMVERFAMQDSKAFQKWREGALDMIMVPYLYNAPAIKLPVELIANYDLFFKRDIIPESQTGIAAYLQAQQSTSKASVALAKAIKEIQTSLGVKDAEGVSPILIDHVAKGLLGTWGRDLVVMSDAATDLAKGDGSWDFMSNLSPYKTVFRDPQRSAEGVDRFWNEVGKHNGHLTRFTESVRFLQNNNRTGEALDLLQSGEPAQRIYATLQVGASGEARGGKGFPVEVKALHPLVRAEGAVREIGDVIRGLQGNNLYASTDGKFIQLPRDERTNAIDALSRLRMLEARNALILAGVPGSEGRKYLNANDQFKVIEAASPAVAEELAQRYANKRVYKFDTLVDIWPKVSDEILRNGGDARLQSYARPLQRRGNFEFEGRRDTLVRKPKVELGGTR